MGRFTKFVITPLAGLFLLSLTACQQNPNTISTEYKAAPYKRIIQFASNHEGLMGAAQKIAQRDRSFIIKHNDDFSEFRIILGTQIQRINNLETKPLLMGRLQKTSTPVNFKVSYQLTNTSRHVIAKGTFEEMTEISSSIYPKLSISKNINADTLNRLAKKIMKDVQAHIKTTPWSTTVIGQKDGQHITVAASKETGLTPGALFMTESQPKAILQVAMFEETATGQSRAILRLKEGFIPTVGRRLVPVQ
ncbi:MAG: hypothetical protein ACI9TY_001271 [Alphaproteobacteria bacterium]|jgi:hypothetical protein